jgi:hypothetical protein
MQLIVGLETVNLPTLRLWPARACTGMTGLISTNTRNDAVRREANDAIEIRRARYCGVGMPVACRSRRGLSQQGDPTDRTDRPGRSGRFRLAAGGRKLQASLRQPVVVEDRPGANGIVGATYVLGAPADGYTLMMGHIGLMTINSHIYKQMQIEPLTDFAPVTRAVTYSNLLLINNKLPVHSVAELIKYAKENPGGLSPIRQAASVPPSIWPSRC